MERSAVRRARAREKNKAKAMRSKSDAEEHRRQRDKEESIAFNMLLMLNYPRKEPWNTNKLWPPWWKPMYMDRSKEVHSLESYPKVCSCYYDADGLTFEVSKENYVETCHYIYKHLSLLYSVFAKYVHVIADYVHGSKKDTARSSVHRVCNKSKEAMLAGVVKGRFMCETGITVRHLFDHDQEKYEEVKLGAGLSGRCYGKELEVVVDWKTYTADIAAFVFPPSPNNPFCLHHLNEIDINGQIYQPKLWTDDESSILPETVVWMVNQDGKLKIGKVRRLLLYDKLLKLYNVMQIASENSGESFSKEGDSGCRIFLPPRGAERVVYVIGMVISEATYKTLKLTNAIWLGKVLPAFLRTLSYSSSKGPYSLCRDDDLPVGLNLTEGLEFSGLAGEFENVSVESLQPLQSEYDSGILVEDSSKELSPGSGLFESHNCTPAECNDDSVTANGINWDSGLVEGDCSTPIQCTEDSRTANGINWNSRLFESYSSTPVECSEASLKVDGIDCNTDVLENVDSAIDTLATVLGDQH